MMIMATSIMMITTTTILIASEDSAEIHSIGDTTPVSMQRQDAQVHFLILSMIHILIMAFMGLMIPFSTEEARS